VTFFKSDILSDDLQDHAGQVDILVSNPPYVSAEDYSTIEPELEHEPRIAITDEAHGLTFYERIIDIASHLLTPPGVLLFELGYDVADAVRSLAIAHGFTVLRIVRDLQGVERVLVARRNV
jgi:release factor glutamine methyltransferase